MQLKLPPFLISTSSGQGTPWTLGLRLAAEPLAGSRPRRRTRRASRCRSRRAKGDWRRGGAAAEAGAALARAQRRRRRRYEVGGSLRLRSFDGHQTFGPSEHQRGHEHAAHQEGVEQHAEGHDEADLGEEHERQHGEHREGAGQHDARARDHAAGDGQRAQHALARCRA